MAAIAGKVWLSGGPCGGRLHTITEAEARAATLVCKGKHYNATPYFHGAYVVYGFQYKAGDGEPKPTLDAPHALGGWKALRKSVNRGMPHALDYSHKLSTATLRSLARTRKVRI